MRHFYHVSPPASIPHRPSPRHARLPPSPWSHGDFRKPENEKSYTIKVVSHDDVRLVSHRYGLSGRPDRIVQVGRYYIPEEKKPGRQVSASYRAQLGVYVLLVEDHYGIRPPYGVLVLGDGRRVKIANTAELRSWVLAMAAKIRQHRQALAVPLPPPANPRQCLSCGQRGHCTVRLA